MARRARRPISLSLRFSVLERDKYACQYCGREPPEVVLEIDHVTPVALGGGNGIDNLLTGCRDCNLGKGARDPGLAMPSRPLTDGERRAEAVDNAGWWAECALWGADVTIKSLMWKMAALAEEDGVLLTLPRPNTPERAEIERLVAGLIAVGAARTKGRGGDEWWGTLELNRARSDDPGQPWGLETAGPIACAPSASEVYG